MSWAAPANRQDLLFLEPTLRYCHRVLEFVPDLVVGDMAYIHLQMQRRLRENLRVGIVTRLRPDFDLPKELEPGLTLRCAQGQRLEWLGLHERDQLHWFGVRESQPLCPWCPEQTRCPREFSFAPSDHEIVFGTVPYSSRVATRLLRQVRSWIEASQSFEKNQLGLSQIFLNSLRFCWTMTLLADMVSLLRTHAAIKDAPSQNLLRELLPQQLNLEMQELQNLQNPLIC